MSERIQLDDLGQRLLFRHARTHNAWQPIPVNDEMLEHVYNLMKYGPTAANSCPLRILFIKTTAAKEKLKPALDAGNVDKTMSAPVTAIFARDTKFHDQLPKLFPHADARSWFAGNDALIDETSHQGANLQAAYFIMAARAMGLDCGPMAGFNKKIVKDAFLADTSFEPIMLCNLGYGDPTKLYPRLPRLSFSEVAQIL